MFNNPFLKKDPLVEAVQSAMQDGELRRQAEALVNEEFGVYSRKAVVREQLAAYDARLEEAYKCMKEAPDTGESDARKTVTSSKEAKEKVFAKHKERMKKLDDPKADYSKMREKMVGKGKDLETTRKIVGEAKKLADKDYDKDGKIESPKDEVWGSRFRAAKMAGKMEEEQIEEGQVTGPRSYKGSPDRKRKAVQMALGRKHKDHPDWNPRTNPQYSALKLGRKLQKQGVTEEEQIDEVSAGLAQRAAHRAFVKSDKMKADAKKEPDMHSYVQAVHKGEDKSKQGVKFANYAAKKMKEEVEFSQAEIDHINSFFEAVAPNRPEVATGADSTSDKMSQNDVTVTAESGKRIRKEEVELDEIKKDTLKQYVKKAAKDPSREKGVDTALDKLANRHYGLLSHMSRRAWLAKRTRDRKEFDDWSDYKEPGKSGPDFGPRGYMGEEVELDEINKKTLKSYVGKVEKRGETEKRSEGLYRAQKGIAKQTSTKTLDAKVRKLASTPVNQAKHDFEYDASREELNNRGIHRFAGRRTRYEEVELEEGRPKKNPTPETTERDPRQHIQVAAGRAAAGSVIDFPHNDGTKSKITPAMGRKITSHLNSLKPADRQAAVNKMHDSAEGLKV